ncbi:MAG TPA: hypothetical protein VGN00_02535 [Puia sp.]|jgi:hypothetical protein
MGLIRRLDNWFTRKQDDAAPYSEAEKALEEKRRQEDPGKFTYGEDGFTYAFPDGPEFVCWSEIQRIATYKVDRMTFDEICLDIFWNDWKLTITEDTPGWGQLVIKLKGAFPTIPEDWFERVMQPAFATNYTVLYEREERVSPK